MLQRAIRKILMILTGVLLITAAGPAMSQNIWVPWKKPQAESVRKAPAEKRTWLNFFFGNENAQSGPRIFVSRKPGEQRDKVAIQDYEPQSAEMLMERAFALQAPHRKELEKIQAEGRERLIAFYRKENINRNRRLTNQEREQAALQEKAAKAPLKKAVTINRPAQQPAQPPVSIYNKPGEKKPVKVFTDFR